jgi:sulfite reductase (NADPH) hemoprotein beta-component
MYRYTDFDRKFVHARAAQYRDQLQRHLRGELSGDDFKPLRLQNGWYVQRHAPMLRVAIPYGAVSAAQVRTLAKIAREFDRGYAHFTTRQNLQYNWIPLARSADVMDALAAVDMHGIQTSGNCIRNITSDAFAGVAPDEIVDARPYCEILRQWSTLHPEFAFLPRKFKIAVSGAKEDRAAIGWHDIGLQLRRNERGAVGFEVYVGGGMGRTPIIGTLANAFVPWQQILVFIEAIVRVYNRYGRRDNAYKARIKILVKAEGQKFFDAVNAEFQSILERDLDGAAHLVTQAELDRVAASFVVPAGVRPNRSTCKTSHARSRAGSNATSVGIASRVIAPSRCRSSAPARRRATPPMRSWKPRPIWPSAFPTASCASRTSRTWCCRGSRRATCSRSGKRPRRRASPRPTSAWSAT